MFKIENFILIDSGEVQDGRGTYVSTELCADVFLEYLTTLRFE